MIAAVIIFLIGLSPFISSLAFPALRLNYSLILCFFLAVWLLRHRKAIAIPRPIGIALVCFLLSLAAAALFARDKIASCKEFSRYITGAVLFMFAASIPREGARKTIAVLTWGGILIGILAIYQFFFGFSHLGEYVLRGHRVSNFAMDYIQQRRVFLPFITPNILAGYLAMVLPLVFIEHKKIPWFILPVAAALILTKSLGGILSFLAALFVYGALRGRMKTGRLILLAALMAVALGAVFAYRTSKTPAHLTPSHSTVMRLQYWQETAGIIKSSVLAGVGPGNFNLRHSRYAHNSYLQMWAESGLIGLLSLCWLVYLALKNGFRRLRDPGDNGLFSALLAAQAAFFLDNLVSFGFFLPEVSLVWWVLLGVTASCRKELAEGCQ